MKSRVKGSVRVRIVGGEEVVGDLDGSAANVRAAAVPEPIRSPDGDGPRRSTKRAAIRSSWIPQIEEAIRKSCEYFYRVQYPDGYWWAELESNVTITSEYVMLTRLLGISITEKRGSFVRYLLRHQNDNGSWGLYYGDGGELSTSI